MGACLALTAWLSLAVIGAGMAWAEQHTPQPDGAPAAAQQPAPMPAPKPAVGEPRVTAEPGVTHRDLEHLKEVTKLEIKVLEVQVESIGDRLFDAIAILSILIVVASAGAGISAYFTARREAQNAVDKWINDEGGKVLDRLTEEAGQEITEFIDKRKREIEDRKSVV